VIQDFSQPKKSIWQYIIYGMLALDVIIVVTAMLYPPTHWNMVFRIFVAVFFLFLICKVFCVIFLLPEDLVRGVRWIVAKLKSTPAQEIAEGIKISRAKFVSRAALVVTAIPFAGFIYGMIRGGYKYRVHHVKVPSPNLPEAFDGFKIIQLSDIHTGSFFNTHALNKAIDIALAQKPDLILFTGDLVNNEAIETQGFESTYSRLKAPYGVYSVLGNHDYGDYKNDWGPGEKVKNLEMLKTVQKNAGWRLLMNEHVALQKNGQEIALIGIENWGGNMHFPKYGRMDLAYKGAEKYPFKILMSHDPSHWDKQVSTQYKDVDLTLSGHTHGMQLGIEIPGLKWSPAKYVYPHWGGLYKQGPQYLYVNRGLGFIGYPGRLGIWPEITVLELKKA